MQKPELPANEPQRLQALHQLRVLDTLAEERFDRLTRLARRLFDVPIALISLIDSDRQWFKSRQGFTACETERDISFCAHAILEEAGLVVENALADARFASNPLVSGPPHIRFYAGVPLHEASGYRIGTLCIIDNQPRRFSEQDQVALRDLADTAECLIMADVRQQQTNFGLASHSAYAQKLIENMQEGFSVISPDGIQQQVNPAFCKMTGFSAAELLGQTPPYPYWPDEQYEAIQQAFAKTLTDGAGSFELIFKKKTGERFPVMLSVSSLKDEQGNTQCYFANATDITPEVEAQQALLASRDQYASLVNNIPGITYRCLLDEQWTMLYMSDHVDPLSGYPATDFIHNAVRSYASVIHPDDSNHASQAVINALQTGRDEWRVDYRILHRDGSIRWAHERGSVARDETGTVSFLDGFILDITDRKQADEALHHQRWLYETILEHSLAGYWDWDIPQGQEYLSPTFKKMLGYQDSEMENSPEAWQKIIFQEDLPCVLKNFDEHISSHGSIPFDNEVRYHHKDGSTVWVRCLGQVVEWGPNGDPLRMVGCHTDITVHKESLRQIQRQLEAFTVLNQLAGSTHLTPEEQIDRALTLGTGYLQLELGIVSQIRDKEYEIRALHAPRELELLVGQGFNLNETYCDLVIQRDELIAIEHMEHSHYRDHPCYQASRLESYIGIRLDVEGTHYGTLNFSSRLPRNVPFNAVDRLFMRLLERWIAATIERERATLAIKQSEVRLRGLFELSPIGIALNDYKTGVFIDLNEALLRPTGYGREEFIALNYWDITPKEYEPQEAQQKQSMEKTGRYGPYEKEYIRKDGSRYPVLLNGVVVHDVSGRKLIWSIIEDITERKRVERMKSEFVSTVSHELRTPLTSISGALGLLVGGAFNLPVQAKQMLDIACKNSQRLTLLINDLLDMETIDSGKLRLELQMHPLVALIKQALETNQPYAHALQVSLCLTGSPADAQVYVDGHRFQQVMSNLLSNAIKYSPAGGTVEIDLQTKAGKARVAVSDKGSGIPDAFRSRIFQRFSQADSTDTRQKGGTGLGLAISQELVERMAGEIGFYSEEGKGTTFWFELPLQSARETALPRNLAIAADRPRILVVEDEPDIAQLLNMILTQAGYQIDIAVNGADALAALERVDYKALSLDLMLPDMSGLEIIRKVRQNPATQSLPIVVVSAKMEDGRLTVNEALGKIDWLSKPIDQHCLLAALERQISLTVNAHWRVLHVEYDDDLFQVVRAMVEASFDVVQAKDLHEARARLTQGHFDLVVLDIGLTDGSGWNLLNDIHTHQPMARIIILSANGISADEASKVDQGLLKSQLTPQQLIAAFSQPTRPQKPSEPKGAKHD